MSRVERTLISKRRRTADGWSERRTPDRLIVEEPLSIELDGTAVTSTMRTPGHDFELAAGFCLADGLLGGASIERIRYCGGACDDGGEKDYHTVRVETGGLAPAPTARLGNVSSSCGWCGSAHLDELCERIDPLPHSDPIDFDVLAALPEKVVARQKLFADTGAVHGAAAFDAAGDLLVVREDVGRHNAVDKVVGRLLLDGALPAHGQGLFVSGRASIEMVQKAWAAGFGTLIAVSAPTALAVETARRCGMTLVGFARGDALNVYA
ncbi:MAG: formate dehydrogenase accessory sulfurtransferase FdhD [Ilumatobacteraceae bacterium]|nr:formate dehydrogenase accessory sulfurtransferase FdhD [Ilumatobacteraceae bacterium]